jgi:hypothetical protein
MMPNDETEQDRLDLQNQLFRLTVEGPLYLAPIPKDVHAVLDCGTGTGIVLTLISIKSIYTQLSIANDWYT